MKSIIIFILFFVVFSAAVFGQNKDQILTGKISFVTSNNVYVKFDNTATIQIGDTLQILGKNIACLLVKNKSSSSVVCSIINNCEINK